ncbi:uncharacterized protein [Centruroides vittatus]|uniref:uncharacterized protein n=1 Tax=Centruroides vittatus TaxID=120091 RepID=UPI0035108B3A
MCESTFVLGSPKPITESATKFNYVVAHLLPEVASTVRDIIISPDHTDPYGHIKVELIKRSGKSSQQELRKLLAGGQLGDRKPSELLRVLKRRAENFQIPDAVILELFVQHLSTSVQSILTVITPLDVDKAAEVADRVVEVTPATIASVSQPEKTDTVTNKILVEIDKPNKRIDKLTQARRDRSDHFSRRSRSSSGHATIHLTAVSTTTAGTTTVLAQRHKNVLRRVVFQQTRTAKRRGDMHFARTISSPVHPR